MRLKRSHFVAEPSRRRQPHIHAVKLRRPADRNDQTSAAFVLRCAEENLARAEERIATAAANRAQVVLLPEALQLGWTHPPARTLADPIPDGPSCRRLSACARRLGVYVCAGLVELSGGEVFNSAVLESLRIAFREIEQGVQATRRRAVGRAEAAEARLEQVSSGTWKGQPADLSVEVGSENFVLPFVTLEIYNVTACNQFLTGQFAFSSLYMGSVNNQMLTPNWVS